MLKQVSFYFPSVSDLGMGSDSDAVTRLKKNDVRYRFALTDFDKQFPA